MVNVEETSLRGGGQNLKRKIWEGVRPILEEWTGMELEPSSMYGIRQYTEGAILSPHADRNPLITSCIINVAQDLEEDWPLEVYGRDGLAYNVTMKPGDMVLYESHSLIHGRPFPMKGKYFANIFVSANVKPWQVYESGHHFLLTSYHFFRFISSRQGKSFASKMHPL